MNPFLILGLPDTATLAEAKAAYRRLAMEHHPDRGGVEAEFKKIKAAWDMIEGGWKPPVPGSSAKHKSSFDSQPKSSFAEKPKAKPKTDRPQGPMAGKPAPGYEAKGPLQVPKTRRKYEAGYNVYEVVLEITQDQAFEGCTVQYIHAGYMQDFIVRPGSVSHTETQSFQVNPMIGSNTGFVTVKVHLKVTQKKTPYEEQTRDAVLDVNLCALGMFIGGKIAVLDHLGEKVHISIPPGYDPTVPFEIPGRGFGIEGKRGKLIVNIKPIFKEPQSLTAHELRQLQMLNEMAKGT
jgi:hypothetical protein